MKLNLKVHVQSNQSPPSRRSQQKLCGETVKTIRFLNPPLDWPEMTPSRVTVTPRRRRPKQLLRQCSLLWVHLNGDYRDGLYGNHDPTLSSFLLARAVCRWYSGLSSEWLETNDDDDERRSFSSVKYFASTFALTPTWANVRLMSISSTFFFDQDREVSLTAKNSSRRRLV